MTVSTIERTEGRYEVEEVEFGRVYKWRPASVSVECECGAKLAFTESVTTCEWCGADYTATVSEELAGRLLGDEALHPWHSWRPLAGGGIPF